MKSYDVAVVGVGIVGASAIYALARAGVRVVGIDAGIPGAGTSGTSFAWLNAVRKEPEAYHRLNADGMAAHRRLAKALGGDVGHHDGGSLEWAVGDEAQRELRARVERLRARGYAAEWITRADARRFEPGLRFDDTVTEVALFAGDGWLDAPRLIGRLIGDASGRGAEILAATAVRSLRMLGDRIDAVIVDAGEMTVGSVLICVGPATETFLTPLGITMPVGRVPGLLAVTSPPTEPLGHVVHAPGIHLRPDANGGLVLGADDVDPLAAAAGSGARLTELAGLLLERAARVFPAASDVRIIDRRVGVRPMPADRQTIAGRIPGVSNGWVLATHSGVTLGPLLGELIANEIVAGTPRAELALFRPERFPNLGTATTWRARVARG